MKLIGVRSEVRQVTFFVVELDLEIASSQLCRKFLPLARNAIEIQGLYYFASHSLTAFVQACQEKVCVCFFIHSFFLSFCSFVYVVGWYYRHAQWPKSMVADEKTGT